MGKDISYNIHTRQIKKEGITLDNIDLTNDGTSEISFLHDFYDEVSDCILDFGINLEAFRETKSLERLEAHPEVDYIEDLIHKLDGIVLK